MPVSFHLKKEFNLIICNHRGTVEDGEFLDSYKNFFERDLSNLSMNLLVDLRLTDSSQRSNNALRKLSDFMNGQFKNTDKKIKVAVIASKDISFGLARMYEAFIKTVKVEFVVFRAADAALAWLGVPEDML